MAVLQIWQVLPLVPPEEFAWSPYSGLDALCGSVLLISLDGLAQDSLLAKRDLPKSQPVGKADFPTVRTPTKVCSACMYLHAAPATQHHQLQRHHG